MRCHRCKRALNDPKRGYYELAYTGKCVCGKCMNVWQGMQDQAWNRFMGHNPYADIEQRGLSSARQQGITG